MERPEKTNGRTEKTGWLCLKIFQGFPGFTGPIRTLQKYWPLKGKVILLKLVVMTEHYNYFLNLMVLKWMEDKRMLTGGSDQPFSLGKGLHLVTLCLSGSLDCCNQLFVFSLDFFVLYINLFSSLNNINLNFLIPDFLFFSGSLKDILNLLTEYQPDINVCYKKLSSISSTSE